MRRHDSNGDKQTYQPAQKNPIGQPMKSNNKIHKIVQRIFMVLVYVFADYDDVYQLQERKKIVVDMDKKVLT